MDKAPEMSEAAKAERRKHDREYYASHKAQRRETNRRYWERKAAAAAEPDQQGKEKSPANVTSIGKA